LPTLNISDVLRQLTVGLFAFGVAFLVEPTCLRALLGELGPVGTPLAAFTIGVVVYGVYRPLVLFPLIHRFKDWLAGPDGNYRRVLRGRYGMPRRDAEYFWVYLRAELSAEKMEYLRREASGVHFLYMASLLSLLGAGYALTQCNNGVASALAVVTVVLGIAGVCQDQNLERIEFFNFRSLKPSAIDRAALSCGYRPTSTLAPPSDDAEPEHPQ
jgi:hypothetical protein